MAPVRTMTPTALSTPGSPRTVTPSATAPAPLSPMPDSNMVCGSTRTRRFDTVLPGDWMSSEKPLLGERRMVPLVPWPAPTMSTGFVPMTTAFWVKSPAVSRMVSRTVGVLAARFIASGRVGCV